MTDVVASVFAAWEVAPVAGGAALAYFPARRHSAKRKHRKALDNIANLERELGYDVPLEQRIERELRLVPPPPDEPVPASARIGGFCDYCSLYVTLNDGKCSFGDRRNHDRCAKRVYKATGKRKATPND